MSKRPSSESTVEGRFRDIVVYLTDSYEGKDLGKTETFVHAEGLPQLVSISGK
jgi:hypothetical protein